MSDALLEEMQSKIAFLERASGELSDVGANALEDTPRTLEQERPPHY